MVVVEYFFGKVCCNFILHSLSIYRLTNLLTNILTKLTN